ncbi:right-handed parallel beta-helix repeat-containing protein [Paenibacillus sp. MWE-103]|uniref:Right-handed parallel beta-helix repeat-containing protein n=1 Tax=Paenibacillus artemisiicola TaxID=1172618 RepID=A0ABS3WIH9_9BACL|nr:right-handed parallel beta-helix repeat-containing protein [Paenibacillus artemisiicola]MBO7748124.1 right-handed parallel beta-helix repeat-containing protein [Paenibacillus artemisiicola]
MKTSKRWRVGLAAALAAVTLQLAGAGAWAPHRALADAAPDAAAGAAYYVDASAGDDANAGTDEDHPWKTLRHVTDEGVAGAFHPGDRILLKSGSVWNERFEMKFSGSPEGQITVGAYGGDAKPVINGGGLDAAVKIENQQYVTLQDIEITNFNAANPDDYKTVFHKRSGVWLMAYHNGPMSGIQLKGLDIHDVAGLSVSGEDWVHDPDNPDPNAKINKNANAAIMINAWEWETVAPDKHGYYKDLLIENNRIHDIRTIGINMDGGYINDLSLYHKNVVIRGNTIDKTGSDGIVVGVAENPVIENNAVYDVGINSYDFKWIAGVWVWKTNGATIRHNEVARVHYKDSLTADSTAFDTDILAQGDHYFEYNYSHDNAGGFVMDMGQLTNGTNYYRYNVSRNDQNHRASGRTVEVSDPGVFYNNVFYNDNGDGLILANNPESTYINNIFYTPQGNPAYPAAPAFYNNDFFGAEPPSQGIRNLNADPRFVDPSGGDGIAKAEGFKLQPSSPLIGEGRAVPNNGGRDLFGNALYTGSPDIGLFEDPASTKADATAPAAPAGLKAEGRTDAEITLSWTAAEDGVPLDADIYDAATDAKLASVVMKNSATLTGLQPDTDYSFYVVARDLSGNESPRSDALSVRTTFAAVVVDDADAAVTGDWTAGSSPSANGAGYRYSDGGSGAGTIVWTPDLPADGYYAVYYRLPQRPSGEVWATDASFKVAFDGGAKTFAVNEYNAPKGEWVPLGNLKFKAGSAGSVTLSDGSADRIVGDAVRFQYLDAFGPDNMTAAALTSNAAQLEPGKTAALNVTGTDAAGRPLDLKADGPAIRYDNDAPSVVSVSADGVVTAIKTGAAHLQASVTLGGRTIATNSVTVYVGSGLTVLPASFADADGRPVTALQAGSTVKIKATVVNFTSYDRPFTLIAGYYDDNGLVRSFSDVATVKSGASATLTATLDLPETIKRSGSIRVFVWDGTGTLHPLATKTVFPG